MTFKTGDKVRTTLEGDRYYNRVGVVKRGTLDAHPHEYYLVTFDELEGEWYQVDLLELADTATDHTAAVIEAARKVLKHVEISAQDEGERVHTTVRLNMLGSWRYWEGYLDDMIVWGDDTLFTAFNALSDALEAYDEAEPDDNLTYD